MHSVSDMFIRIKNAQRAGHATVSISYSQFKHEIARALLRAKLVSNVERKGKKVKKNLILSLLYSSQGQPRLKEVRLISRQGRRIYAPAREINSSQKGGAVIISTSKGVVTGAEARKERVGGEVVAEVW